MRVGVIGGGPMAHAHLRMIRRVPGAEIVGLADLNPQALAETATSSALRSASPRRGAGRGGRSRRSSTSSLRPTPIARSPSPRSSEGCHVYVEKPMGVDARRGRGDARRGREAQEAPDHASGHNFLFDPTMLEARAAIDRGEIGEICGIESYFGMDLGTNPKSRYFSEAYKHWAYQMPGSLQQNILDHPLALVVPFMGEPKSVHTLAVEGVLPQRDPGRAADDDRRRPANRQRHRLLRRQPRFHYVRYLGTHATLHVDLQNQRLQRYGHREGVPHFVTRAMMNVGESTSIVGNTLRTTRQGRGPELHPVRRRPRPRHTRSMTRSRPALRARSRPSTLGASPG